MMNKRDIKSIKSLRDLNQYQEKLKYERELHEQQITGIGADIAANIGLKLRATFFEAASRAMLQLLWRRRK